MPSKGCRLVQAPSSPRAESLWQSHVAAGTIAARVSKGRASTVSVEEIQFHRPVLVGDEVSLYAEMLKIGRTSMRIRVRAWRRARHQEETQQVTEAIFTFVALDDHARPRPVLRAEE